MPLGTQFGYSASGLASCVIRDLDASAPRPRLPPRALPDDVRERILRNKKKTEEKLATEAGFVNPNTNSEEITLPTSSTSKMSARAAARAEAEALLLQESKLGFLPKPALIAKLTGAKAAAANTAAAIAAKNKREAEAQSAVFGSKQGLLAQSAEARQSFGGSTLSKTSTGAMRRSLGGGNTVIGVSTAAAAPIAPRRMKM